jgi:signal transduction histidine kinase
VSLVFKLISLLSIQLFAEVADVPNVEILGRLDNKTFRKEVVHKLQEVMPASTWSQLGLFALNLGVSFYSLSITPAFFIFNSLVLAGLLCRLWLVKFGMELGLKEWHDRLTVFLGITAVGWAGVLINAWYSNLYGYEGKFFHFILLMGLLTGGFVNLSYSKRDFILFNLSLFVASANLFWQFEAAEFRVFGLGINCLFFAFLFKQRSEAYKTWEKSVVGSQELKSILDAFPGGISVLNGEKYVFVNRKVAEIARIPAKNIIGQTLGFADSDSAFSRKAIEFINGPKARASFELEMGRADSKRNHLVVLERLRGFKDMTVIASIDTHEAALVRNQLEIQQAKLSSSAKMAALGEMAGGVAHEVNNPLAVINSRAAIMLKAVNNGKVLSPEDLKKSLETIQKGATRIAAIVRGLKAFSRNGEQDPMNKASLTAIIEDTLIFCEAKFANNSVKLEVQMTEEAMLINCRETQISQVVLNLLGNAYDAVQDYPEKWVRLETQIESNSLVVRVIDSGKGIPPEIREKILQPFFTTKEVGKGTGLGLSISKGIIEDHGGTMIINADHPNTCFEIRLPMAQAEEKVA